MRSEAAVRMAARIMAFLMTASTSTSTEATSASRPPVAGDAIEARLDRWLRPYLAAGDFSGVVLIADGGRVLVERAYGKADFARGVPNRIETRFRIASLSKTFTAAAIELLAARGKLRLEDPLSRHLPNFPNGDKITVEQLLLHKSGVGTLDIADNRDCPATEVLIQRLMKTPAQFAPGTSSHYSNEGYFLLAVIVEKVSGQPFAQFLQENIFTPLGLTNTGSACKAMPPGANAKGNVAGADGSVEPIPFDQTVEIGPGSIYSNVHDLHRWLEAVATNPLFQVDHLRYPYGWGKRNYSGRRLIEQSGLVEGFFAHMALYPQEHLYAVVLSNIQSGLFNRLPKDLEAVLFEGKVSAPPDVKRVTVSAAALRDYTGEYQSPAIPVPQHLVLKDGRLYLHWGASTFLRALTATGKDEFFFRCEYAKVRFERDGHGKVSRAIWQWAQGDPMTFVRATESR